MIRQLNNIITAKLGANAWQYLENIIWLVAEKGIQIMLGLVVGVYVARVLGPDKYGLLGYAQGIVAMMTVFASLGLDNILVKNLVRQPERRNEWLLTAGYLQLIAGAGLALISLGYWVFFRGIDSAAGYILIISLALPFSAFTVLALDLQAMVASRQTVLARTCQSMLSSGMRFGLAFNRSPLTWFAWVSAMEGPLYAALLTYFHRKVAVPIKWGRFQVAKSLEILNESWPLFISAISVTLYMRIDQIMLKWMVGTEQTGLYLAALRLSEIWNFIPMVVCSTLLPSILKTRESDPAKYKSRLEMLYVAFFYSSFLIALLITFLSPVLIKTLFGVEFLGASSILQIYIWTLIPVALGVASGQWLLAEGMQSIILWRTALGLVFNVILNYILIPRHGAIGAAAATLISYFVATFLGASLFPRSRPLVGMLVRSIYINRLWK